MAKPCMPEVDLLDDPLQAMQARLQQLLADWPENPILTQLLVLCQRLTGERCFLFVSLRTHCEGLSAGTAVPAVMTSLPPLMALHLSQCLEVSSTVKLPSEESEHPPQHNLTASV